MNVRFLLGLSIVLLFSSIQSPKAQVSVQYGIPYDTVFLKNETKLIYSTTEKSRIIRIITPVRDTILRLGKLHTDLPTLGCLKADYEDCFVLYDDDEAGFAYMQVYKKETGKLLAIGAVVFFDTLKNVLIYATADKIDILYLYDFKRSTIEKYFTPSTNCLRHWYCIQVKSISETQFTIEYYAKNTNIKTKKTFTRTKTSP